MPKSQSPKTEAMPHKRWVKGSHFIITLSFVVLTVSGYIILMSPLWREYDGPPVRNGYS